MLNRLLLVSLITLLSVTRVSANEPGNDSNPQWEKWPVVGHATLSWLWLDIYSSKLRSPDGVYVQQSDVSPHPMALEIRYLRDITRQQLLDATSEQWQKQGYRSDIIEQWMPQLADIFPGVKTGEKLVYVTDGKQGSFIHIATAGQQKVVGNIDDESLNDAFLSIWLSPKTEYRKLREQLIGMNR